MIDLTDVPFVDGHMHPPLRVQPSTLAEYRRPWYEGHDEDVALVADLVPYRWGVRELAGWIGCEADDAAVHAAVAAKEPAAWLGSLCERSRTTGLVLDTGYPIPPDGLSTAEVRALGVDVAPLLRLELVAGTLLADAPSFGAFLEAFDAQLASARSDGYQGLKSVVAYRTGLAVELVDAAAAEQAFARNRGSCRIVEKALLDFLLVRSLVTARRDDLPVQLHAGYGDRDLDLRLVDPLWLRPLLESGVADGVPLVLLHGAWPWTRGAAYLAAVYPNVWLDVATCIPPLGMQALLDTWRQALAVAPLSRIQASSDAAGLSEHVALGAERCRRSLGIAVAELVGSGELSAGAAEDAAQMIMGGNARALYW